MQQRADEYGILEKLQTFIVKQEICRKTAGEIT
jgi:hypothetical protein